MAELKWLVNSGNYYYFGDAPAHVTGVSLDKSSISLTEAGQTEQLTATIIPVGALEQGVTWSSSDDSVATVSNTGLVTCITPGECTITVTTVYGGYTDTCEVYKVKFTPGTDAVIYLPLTSTTELQNLGQGGYSFNKQNYTSAGSLTYDNLGITFSNAGIASTANVSDGDATTVGFWAKANSYTGTLFTWSYRSGNNYGTALMTASQKSNVYIYIGNSEYYSNYDSINYTTNLNQWYFYSFREIRDGNNNRVIVWYINGVEVYRHTGWLSGDKIYLGIEMYSNGNLANPFDGSISDFFVYNEDLGVEKLQYYFNKNKSKYGY